MKSEDANFITISAQVGGEDADNATNVHVHELRSKLQRSCDKVYSSSVKCIVFLLFIDGSVQSWEQRTIEKFGFRKKSKLATADILMPVTVWSGCDAEKIRSFLADETRTAINGIVSYLQLKRIEIDGAGLKRDVEIAIKEFLK